LHNGVVVLRNEDLDASRCRAEFVTAMLEDLRWFGFQWHEGPDIDGSYAPYTQSQRMPFYKDAFARLRSAGVIYPCSCSRQDVLRALAAPHVGEEEPIYPGTCRSKADEDEIVCGEASPRKISWRFRVTDGERIAFEDGHFGLQEFVAGKDFGDFVIWRHDGVPSYQLAVVVDDAAMRISEVVRGADLLLSTARQILVYRALKLPMPAFFHCPLVTDEQGVRLAKRHDSLSLRRLKEQGSHPEKLREAWNDELSFLRPLARVRDAQA
jgi:glutamyl/glutaminyl-tRNA synthetase